MLINRFWSEANEEFKHPITGELFSINVWGGSRLSEADARSNAFEKIEMIKKKILGEFEPLENYQVEIREELVEEINSTNMVTRNRYGALVLNSQDVIFLDVDEPKRGFFDLFKSYSLKEKKEKMFQQILKTTELKDFKFLGFRIYETKKGFRIIVMGKTASPKDPLVTSLFKKFNCDRLYASLCRKQNCYRARLSPKPSYMKHKMLRVKFPNNCEKKKQDKEQWLNSYEAKSSDYQVCRLRKEVRPQGGVDSIVRYHDEVCGVDKDLPFA